VQENGFVSGTTYDKANPENAASWKSDRPANCVAAKRVKKLVPRAKVNINSGSPKKLGDPLGPAESPSTATPPGMNKAIVTGDVDVYDTPGGEGMVIGMLSRGAEVSAACRDDQWCAVRGDVPNGKGWVWGEFLAF
jgi:hypothetical protein